MRVRSAFPFVVSITALVLSVLPAACSNQGEGDFCDTLNGNNDCQSDLICVEQAPGLVAMQGIATSRCCPADSTQATTAACMASVTGFDASNEVGDASSSDAGAEASAPEASVPDAGGPDAPEASTDAAHDAMSSDATVDHAAPPAADGAVDAPPDAGPGGDASDGAPD